MTYYPTIDEDIARAREILEKGKTPPPEWFETSMKAAWGTGGTIYGADIFAAYKLLESFVDEIERLRAALEEIIRLSETRTADLARLRQEVTGLTLRTAEALRDRGGK